MATCYVNLVRGPRQVYQSYMRGRYEVYDPEQHDQWLGGEAIRFGAYGDPAAIPASVWQNMQKLSGTHTGYTHAWRYCAPEYAQFLMASVDTEEERVIANNMGWRTFRVREPEGNVVKGEIVCPASHEFEEVRGYKITCIECGLCAGASRKAKDIVIIAHGISKKRFSEEQAEELRSPEPEYQLPVLN